MRVFQSSSLPGIELLVELALSWNKRKTLELDIRIITTASDKMLTDFAISCPPTMSFCRMGSETRVQTTF